MEIDHKLSKLLDIDNILWVITFWVDDLGTPSHLGMGKCINDNNVVLTRVHNMNPWYSCQVQYNVHNKTITSTK